MPRHLRLEFDGGVATVVFDRPPVNSVNLEVIEEFLAMVDRLAADNSVRAVVVTGTSRSFCAGADIAMMRDLSAADERVRRWVDVQAGIEALSKPVVAAIRGYALGGGADLALACDVRFAGAGATIGYPEIELGIFSASGGTQRLARLVGPTRALRLMIDGTRLGAHEAARLGLVDEVTGDEDVLPAAQAYARALAGKATRAIGLLKRCVYGAWGRTLLEGVELEEAALSELIETDDAREGLSAFVEKRPPRFRGR